MEIIDIWSAAVAVIHDRHLRGRVHFIHPPAGLPTSLHCLTTVSDNSCSASVAAAVVASIYLPAVYLTEHQCGAYLYVPKLISVPGNCSPSFLGIWE